NPFIATNDATGITFNSADLHGTTNPAGSPTAAWFEWGKTTSFGSRTDAETFAAGTTTAVTFVTSIRNLEPHTTYYFRAVLYRAVAGAETSDGHRSARGAALGEIKTFTTSDAPAVVPLTVTTGDATAV